MATTGELITKQAIINDFVSAVMAPEQNRSRWHINNQPTASTTIGGYDSTNTVTPYVAIQPVLVNSSISMANPTVTDFPETLITANNIVSVLRNYAYGTTRVRSARAGIFYNYSSGASGTFGEAINYAHLNDTYLRTNPLSVSGPSVNQDITATALNTFYTSLRLSANTDNYGDIIDLRICHTSCHSACHSSRGRR